MNTYFFRYFGSVLLLLFAALTVCIAFFNTYVVTSVILVLSLVILFLSYTNLKETYLNNELLKDAKNFVNLAFWYTDSRGKIVVYTTLKKVMDSDSEKEIESIILSDEIKKQMSEKNPFAVETITNVNSNTRYFHIIGRKSLFPRLKYMGFIRDITDEKRRDKALTKMAFYDPITGLANLRLFEDRLNISLESTLRGKSFALVFIDIINFKHINDVYGHDLGDEVLENVAKNISYNIRNTDTGCRYGGDDFYVILNDMDNVNDLETKLADISESLNSTIVIKDVKIEVQCRISGCLAPEHAKTEEEAKLKCSDALYIAENKDIPYYLWK